MTEKSSKLSLRLQRKTYSGETVLQRWITFKGDKLILDDEQYKNILLLIPEVWNTDKDQLVNFVLFSDNTYVCDRKKQVYNFSTKETEEKSYNFDAATESQLNELITIVAKFFADVKIKQTDDLYQSIIDSIKNTKFMKQRLLDLRQTFLSSSDYMFNSDYVFKSEQEKQDWVNYRQQWRDITEQEFWTNNDFSNFSLPISPKPREQFYTVAEQLVSTVNRANISPTFTDEIVEYLNSEDYNKVMENFSALLFKNQVIQSLSSLKIPLGVNTIDNLDVNFLNTLIDGFYSKDTFKDIDINENEELSSKSVIEHYLQSIEEKIELIDREISKYDLNFTINDVINKVVEDINNTAKDYELEREAMQLLEDIHFGENSNYQNI